MGLGYTPREHFKKSWKYGCKQVIKRLAQSIKKAFQILYIQYSFKVNKIPNLTKKDPNTKSVHEYINAQCFSYWVLDNGKKKLQ